jgi:hypothetical protein
VIATAPTAIAPFLLENDAPAARLPAQSTHVSLTRSHLLEV